MRNREKGAEVVREGWGRVGKSRSQGRLISVWLSWEGGLGERPCWVLLDAGRIFFLPDGKRDRLVNWDRI